MLMELKQRKDLGSIEACFTRCHRVSYFQVFCHQFRSHLNYVRGLSGQPRTGRRDPYHSTPYLIGQQSGYRV